jgi:GNAT superfamily N-acetyltransferase
LTARIQIRPAERTDVPLLFSFIVRLAEYERAPEMVTGTEELLELALFGERPSAEAVVAELDRDPAGFAVFHGTFSTWECRAGIWLEDLYVSPEHRRAGIGRALMCNLASTTVERGCARLEWAALDWNSPALAFYDGLGAKRLSDWEMLRLDGAALERVAAESAASKAP